MNSRAYIDQAFSEFAEKLALPGTSWQKPLEAARLACREALPEDAPDPNALAAKKAEADLKKLVKSGTKTYDFVAVEAKL